MRPRKQGALALPWLLEFCLFFAVAFSACGTERGDRKVNMVGLTGMQLQACLIAYADFKPRGFSLENYTIQITESPAGFEVVFVPEHPPGPTVRGGRTVFGQEIKYLISRAGAIEKISYAR